MNSNSDGEGRFVRNKTYKVNKIASWYLRKMNEEIDNVPEDTSPCSPSTNEIESYEDDKIGKDGMLKAPPIESSDKYFEEEIDDREDSPGTYNSRALSKDATTYELEKFEKNILVIFNQINVEGYRKPRYGTEKDVQALTSTFTNFGFHYVVHDDLTKDEMFRELKTFSQMDFTDYGCVVIAVLTHGTKNGLLRAKDQLYSEIEIVNHFKVHNKPTLVTKPRILLIQACRGTRDIQGVPVLQFQGSRVQRDIEEEVEPYHLPVESDMLVLHSSYIGNPSHRDEIHGSWFIQSLCNKIKQLAPTHDFESILTEVKREVAIDKYHEVYNRRTYEMDMNKQMPVLTSTLIRKLYLRRYGDVPRLVKGGNTTNEVLDSEEADLQVQFGPCSCFLDHFDYMRNCLRNFLEENSDDMTGKAFLSVADTLDAGNEFNATKQEMLKAICNHLEIHSKDTDIYKYIHFYKN